LGLPNRSNKYIFYKKKNINICKENDKSVL
jgi:hypothetical protein